MSKGNTDSIVVWFHSWIFIQSKESSDANSELFKEDDEEEPDIILARIDTDENGEAEYVPPTDDEYDAVADIYDAMWETLQKSSWCVSCSFY